MNKIFVIAGFGLIGVSIIFPLFLSGQYVLGYPVSHQFGMNDIIFIVTGLLLAGFGISKKG